MTTPPAPPKSRLAGPWPPSQGQWTYEDWLRLPDDGFRYEVVDGVLHMALPPSTEHQRSSLGLAARMLLHAEKHDRGKATRPRPE